MKFLAPVCQVQPAARRKLTQSHDWKEVTAGCIYGARNTKRIFIIFACLSLRLFCVYNVVQQCCRSFFGSRDPLSTRLQSPCICDAPRIISIWHSVDNSWSLFIYKSFVDSLSNRTGKKKGKRFFVVYFPFKKLFQAPLDSNRIDVFANNRSGSPGPRSLIYLAPLLVLSRPETEPN